MVVVQRSLGAAAEVQQILPITELERFQRMASDLYVDRAVAEYAISLVNSTRHPAKYGIAQHGPHIAFGSSPRGSINLVHAGRALALLRGRRYVLPTDIHDLAKDVLRHRLVLTYQALADGVTSDTILEAALRAVAQPRIELAQELSA
jgi:MoxR-like ATPase